VEWTKSLRLLLDTHALIWWATLNPKLSSKVRKAIADERNDVFVSAASAWEIAIKVRIGKLEWPAQAGSVNAYALDQGFRPLAISLMHAELAGQLRIAHKDPFDRVLIVQAQTEEMLVASNDDIFDIGGARRYW
jgi:PIN domain nuclease of toxin-antitoxin system